MYIYFFLFIERERDRIPWLYFSPGVFPQIKRCMKVKDAGKSKNMFDLCQRLERLEIVCLSAKNAYVRRKALEC